MNPQSEPKPIEILMESSKAISPTLISYDIGSLFEIFIYELLKKATKQFDKVVLVSFHDAFHIIHQYWRINLGDSFVSEVMQNTRIVAVNSLYLDSISAEVNMTTTSPSRLLTDITNMLEEEINDGKRILLFFVGLDMYALNKGEVDFRKLFSLLMLLANRIKNVSIITTLNKNVFSNKTNEFLNSYAFNVAHLKADAAGTEVKYYIEFKRVAMLQYNLNVWEYKLLGKSIRFLEKKVG